MNVLIDTNVLLSAALRDRLPEQVVRYVAAADDCRWIVTEEIVREYVGVIKRPRFGLSPQLLQEWAELISLRTVMVASSPVQIEFPRDPKDAIFLSAALSAGADYLISGGNDLLQCRVGIATRIVSVAEFAAEFGLV
jgi:putative PIN family toxin of toxin-antitoxin system